MPRGRILLSVLAGILGAWALVASAQELAEVTRPCSPADLIGAWEVIRVGTAPGVRIDRSDPAFYPFQRYVFATDATVRHLTSETKITNADHRALLAVAAPWTWAVDANGRLLLLREGQATLDRSACLVLVKEVVDPRSRSRSRPGDLLLTHIDTDDRPLYRRQLRKLEALGE